MDVFKDFEKASGLQVKVESSTNISGVDISTALTTAFSSGTSPFDVIFDSDETSPLMQRAGWLLPLDDIVPKETWDDFPTSMKEMIDVWYTFEGKQYRVPAGLEMGYFFTRQDWLEKRNLKAPKTWDEMVEMGKQFKDSKAGVFGTIDALIKPALLYV